MDDMPGLQTIEELAKEVRSTPAAIYASRYRGDGPVGIRIGRRILFQRNDIDRWLESRREATLTAK